MIERSKLNFKFDPVAHVYTLDGKRMYGVTTVLNVINKPALVQWSANMAVDYIENDPYYVLEGRVDPKTLEEARTAHRRNAKEAADKGTDIHAVIEKIVTGAIRNNDGYVTKKKSNEPQVQKFLDWVHLEPTQFLHSERKLYSTAIWVAGTCDLCFIRNGKRYVADIKTTNAIWDRTPFFQMGAYQIMLEEEGEEYDGRCILRLGKNGDFEVVYSYSPLDKEGFMFALGLFKALEVPVTIKQKHIKKAIAKKKHKK